MAPPRIRLAVLAAAFGVLVAGGCARVPLLPGATDRANCLGLFAAADATTARAGTADAQSARIPGFPFLRTNRFLASFRDEAFTAEQRRTWIAQLARLDREAHQFEHLNLPADARRRVSQVALDACRTQLADDVRDDPARFRELRARAAVGDEYRTWQRVVGFYPLSSMFVLRGVERLRAAQTPAFTAPRPATAGPRRLLYGVARRATGHEAPGPLAVDALGIPLIDHTRAVRLLALHAPVWAVETASDDDRIGAPAWQGTVPTVRVDAPRVYTQIGYTRFAGHVLIQLNYTVWFPARPRRGLVDLLGGALDGITWRVTLDTDGVPLIFDAMHNCGCYHQFFPTPRLRVRAVANTHEEPPWVPLSLSAPLPAPVTLYVARETHYLERIGAPPPDLSPVDLQPADYDDLRSLPVEHHNRRSLFGSDGIIAGTERAERWILWPTGVPAPGAMRQSGHHVTAFVGRRHFDDADLLDRYFVRRDPRDPAD